MGVQQVNSSDSQGFDLEQIKAVDKDKIIDKVEKLTEISIALSAEKDIKKLLEKILVGAKSITNADAGTLYRVVDKTIKFEIIQTDSLGVALGINEDIKIPNIPLYLEHAEPNLKNVVCCSYHHNATINIKDAYDSTQFDFSGTRAFDKSNNYLSKSFLSIPLINHQGQVIGVLQLINALSPDTKEIIAFDEVSQQFAEALASQAATVLTKQQLITDLENLFESLIKLLATAVDKKSPYTGGHCRRVPELTNMLAEAAHDTNEGYLKDFKLNEHDRYELSIAAWLHDCGKIITPVNIVDKATKLETIFDRIELIATRFEVLKRDKENAFLKQQLATTQNNILEQPGAQALAAEIAQIDSDLQFIRQCNIGGEAMRDDDMARLQAIQAKTWRLNNNELPLLTADELYNLSIFRGTLTTEERKVINNHIDNTIEMLEAIKFPTHLKNVVEYAGGHHERMDGKGYPKGLTREQMSIQARIMAIADIFEALTAKDRPYKPGKKLSESLKILNMMKDEGHVDPDLYDVFINKKVYKKYAEKFLEDFQIDID